MCKSLSLYKTERKDPAQANFSNDGKNTGPCTHMIRQRPTAHVRHQQNMGIHLHQRVCFPQQSDQQGRGSSIGRACGSYHSIKYNLKVAGSSPAFGFPMKGSIIYDRITWLVSSFFWSFDLIFVLVSRPKNRAFRA